MIKYHQLEIIVLVNYKVPAACLKMKQGFGRLIRTEYDSGIFIQQIQESIIQDMVIKF